MKLKIFAVAEPSVPVVVAASKDSLVRRGSGNSNASGFDEAFSSAANSEQTSPTNSYISGASLSPPTNTNLTMMSNFSSSFGSVRNTGNLKIDLETGEQVVESPSGRQQQSTTASASASEGEAAEKKSEDGDGDGEGEGNKKKDELTVSTSHTPHAAYAHLPANVRGHRFAHSTSLEVGKQSVYLLYAPDITTSLSNNSAYEKQQMLLRKQMKEEEFEMLAPSKRARILKEEEENKQNAKKQRLSSFAAGIASFVGNNASSSSSSSSSSSGTNKQSVSSFSSLSGATPNPSSSASPNSKSSLSQVMSVVESDATTFAQAVGDRAWNILFRNSHQQHQHHHHQQDLDPEQAAKYATSLDDELQSFSENYFDVHRAMPGQGQLRTLVPVIDEFGHTSTNQLDKLQQQQQQISATTGGGGQQENQQFPSQFQQQQHHQESPTTTTSAAAAAATSGLPIVSFLCRYHSNSGLRLRTRCDGFVCMTAEKQRDTYFTHLRREARNSILEGRDFEIRIRRVNEEGFAVPFWLVGKTTFEEQAEMIRKKNAMKKRGSDSEPTSARSTTSVVSAGANTTGGLSRRRSSSFGGFTSNSSGSGGGKNFLNAQQNSNPHRLSDSSSASVASRGGRGVAARRKSSTSSSSSSSSLAAKAGKALLVPTSDFKSFVEHVFDDLHLALESRNVSDSVANNKKKKKEQQAQAAEAQHQLEQQQRINRGRPSYSNTRPRKQRGESVDTNHSPSSAGGEAEVFKTTLGFSLCAVVSYHHNNNNNNNNNDNKKKFEVIDLLTFCDPIKEQQRRDEKEHLEEDEAVEGEGNNNNNNSNNKKEKENEKEKETKINIKKSLLHRYFGDEAVFRRPKDATRIIIPETSPSTHHHHHHYHHHHNRHLQAHHLASALRSSSQTPFQQRQRGSSLLSQSQQQEESLRGDEDETQSNISTRTGTTTISQTHTTISQATSAATTTANLVDSELKQREAYLSLNKNKNFIACVNDSVDSQCVIVESITSSKCIRKLLLRKDVRELYQSNAHQEEEEEQQDQNKNNTKKPTRTISFVLTFFGTQKCSISNSRFSRVRLVFEPSDLQLIGLEHEFHQEHQHRQKEQKGDESNTNSNNKRKNKNNNNFFLAQPLPIIEEPVFIASCGVTACYKDDVPSSSSFSSSSSSSSSFNNNSNNPITPREGSSSSSSASSSSSSVPVVGGGTMSSCPSLSCATAAAAAGDANSSRTLALLEKDLYDVPTEEFMVATDALFSLLARAHAAPEPANVVTDCINPQFDIVDCTNELELEFAKRKGISHHHSQLVTAIGSKLEELTARRKQLEKDVRELQSKKFQVPDLEHQQKQLDLVKQEEDERAARKKRKAEKAERRRRNQKNDSSYISSSSSSSDEGEDESAARKRRRKKAVARIAAAAAADSSSLNNSNNNNASSTSLSSWWLTGDQQQQQQNQQQGGRSVSFTEPPDEKSPEALYQKHLTQHRNTRVAHRTELLRRYDGAVEERVRATERLFSAQKKVKALRQQFSQENTQHRLRLRALAQTLHQSEEEMGSAIDVANRRKLVREIGGSKLRQLEREEEEISDSNRVGSAITSYLTTFSAPTHHQQKLAQQNKRILPAATDVLFGKTERVATPNVKNNFSHQNNNHNSSSSSKSQFFSSGVRTPQLLSKTKQQQQQQRPSFFSPQPQSQNRTTGGGTAASGNFSDLKQFIAFETPERQQRQQQQGNNNNNSKLKVTTPKFAPGIDEIEGINDILLSSFSHSPPNQLQSTASPSSSPTTGGGLKRSASSNKFHQLSGSDNNNNGHSRKEESFSRKKSLFVSPDSSAVAGSLHLPSQNDKKKKNKKEDDQSSPSSGKRKKTLTFSPSSSSSSQQQQHDFPMLESEGDDDKEEDDEETEEERKLKEAQEEQKRKEEAANRDFLDMWSPLSRAGGTSSGRGGLMGAREKEQAEQHQARSLLPSAAVSLLQAASPSAQFSPMFHHRDGEENNNSSKKESSSSSATAAAASGGSSSSQQQQQQQNVKNKKNTRAASSSSSIRRNNNKKFGGGDASDNDESTLMTSEERKRYLDNPLNLRRTPAQVDLRDALVVYGMWLAHCQKFIKDHMPFDHRWNDNASVSVLLKSKTHYSRMKTAPPKYNRRYSSDPVMEAQLHRLATVAETSGCRFFLNAKSQMARDYVLLIDRSRSMLQGKRWKDAEEAVKVLAPHICKFDPDGICLIFFDHEAVKFDNVMDSKQVHDLFKTHGPRGSTDLAKALDIAFVDHFEGEKGATTILVITDGAPDDREAVKRCITEASNALGLDGELSISFIQIGNVQSATDYLKELDDELVDAQFDIVDTITCEESKHISFNELIARSLFD